MVLKRQLLGFIGVIAMAGSLLARPASAQDWTATPPPEGEVQASFDDALAPYGEWTDVDGTRVWHPSANVVGEDFQPYATNGQWVSSDYGWYFQSDYPWGWAPFHYGRWALDPNYGWIWVPGTVWAPAWVDWRSGGGYIGWAPLPPIGWSVVVQPWRPYWCFVPAAHFSGNFWPHRLPVENIHYAYAATAPVHQAVAFGGARWYAGPPVNQVERVTAQPIQHVASGFTPPAPGRIQSVQLQPPRGIAGGVTPRPASAHPNGPRPPPSMAPPAPRPPPPPPGGGAGRPVPHGEYVPATPRAPLLAQTRLSSPAAWGGAFGHSVLATGFGGTAAPRALASVPGVSTAGQGSVPSSGRPTSGAHGSRR
jgi:hypothetical protein